ncbi:ABC transporter substrate-binding protein [Kribbella jejuensis]|uniref:Peptide/nickel transport system substrate-binding protein n=1 Tax=Kribbella jejuensis TaxID=236068 RepID=A0A542ELQ6_9ACTN|nr:ABC transporter substrate-binding protein [Kribbella jejuensis]TQJ16270.1 peptide/nickel transport system substrate-binding protein [Kribbella jejuensis]
MYLRAPVRAAACAAVLVALVACSNQSAGGGGADAVVDGGTFTMALPTDPGNLDPQSSAASALFTVTQLAYDPLLSVDPANGDIRSGLATKWAVNGRTVTLTLADGIKCSDGTALTASNVVANLKYVGDPKNKSPFLGTFLPAGATGTADDATRTVTITLATPAPFVLNGLASLPIVCPSGLTDRKSLAKKTSGTGPYVLTEAAPGDHYTYQRRDGYTWGPNGATTKTQGMPKTVVMKVIQNETTAANLLLSGSLNAAAIIGPDAQRLEKAGLFAARTTALIGEQWYNHAKGRATSDAAVRMALTQALDLPELRKVLTSGKGTPPTTLATIEPVACTGDAISPSLPARDVEAAKTAVQKAKLPPLTFLYDNSRGSGVAAAAELAVQQWQAVGVKVTAKGMNGTAMNETLFSSGDWDIAWVPLNVNSPDQVVPFLSGPAAPNGTNFAAIQNKDYEAKVKKAASMSGKASCPTWLQAESAVVAAADLVPFANSAVQTFGAKARFATPGQLVPTSIRMLAN